MSEVDRFEEQKKSSGGLASIIWIGTCIYIFFFNEHGGELLSLKGIAFLLVGMFAAAIILGFAFFLLERGIAKVFLLIGSAPSASLTAFLSLIGFTLVIAQVAVTIWATYWAFNLTIVEA